MHHYLLLLLVAATAPFISLNSIGDLEVTEYPHTHEVTGSATSDKPIQDLGLYINDELHGDMMDTISNPGNEEVTTNFSFDWFIDEPGTYTVKVQGKHGNETGSEEEVVTVIGETVIEVDYPAAPAVANKLLKDAGYSNMIGKGRDGTNLISSTAHQMGPGTDFNGVAKSDVDAYEAAVKAFLNTFDGIHFE